MRYLVLGGGPAGIAAAKAIRKHDAAGEILLVREETATPYLRPLLADLILEKATLNDLQDPQGSDLAEHDVRTLLGQRAVRVDPARNRVLFSDGSREKYDFLLLATGGRPEIPGALRLPTEAILPFDSLEDAFRIHARAYRAQNVLVYGPGFLGTEACRSLLSPHRKVTWIHPELPRVGFPLSGELAASLREEIRDRGARILDGKDIGAARIQDHEIVVTVAPGGEAIPCDLLVVATERRPLVDYLVGSGVAVDTGVVVNDYLRTSVPNIYAAGDCAELVDPGSGERRINFGWLSAIKQGRFAGENMAGGGKRFLPQRDDFFWKIFGPPLAERIRKGPRR